MRKTFVVSAQNSEVIKFIDSDHANITDQDKVNALDQLVTDLKNAGLWSKFVLFYPLIEDKGSANNSQATNEIMEQWSYNLVDADTYKMSNAGLGNYFYQDGSPAGEENASFLTGWNFSDRNFSGMLLMYWLGRLNQTETVVSTARVRGKKSGLTVDTYVNSRRWINMMYSGDRIQGSELPDGYNNMRGVNRENDVDPDWEIWEGESNFGSYSHAIQIPDTDEDELQIETMKKIQDRMIIKILILGAGLVRTSDQANLYNALSTFITATGK